MTTRRLQYLCAGREGRVGEKVVVVVVVPLCGCLLMTRTALIDHDVRDRGIDLLAARLEVDLC